MKEYNPGAICPKCGHIEVSSEHHHADSWWYDESIKEPHYTYHTEEIIQRECNRCHFNWHERPMEAANETS